jgi:RND family efflux transporter MFP subunit
VKSWRIIPFLLFGLVLVLTGSVSCNAFGGQEEVTQQLIKVERGDLTVTVSGSGNIEVPNEMKLTFSLAGQIEKIYVQEGSQVAKGEKVAELVTDSLELAVTQAQVAYTQAQLAVVQSQVALETANYNLNQALERYTWPDIKTAQSDVDEAKAYVEYISWNLAQAAPEQKAMWATALAYAQARLAAAEAKLDAMIRNYDTEEVAIQRLQVEAAQQALDLAQQSLTLAEQSLAQAKKQLEEAVIVAPYDGTIARVYVKERDTISPAVPIAQIVDLASMQLKVQVDEIDIMEVRLGQKAVIELDAQPDLKLEGQVNFISLLPTVEGGVVMYDLTLGFSVPENSGLRIGMSATAEIIITERKSVLLVPDRAIKTNSQGKTIVVVSMVGGQTEERVVVTGVSDGLQTEILDGLKEGEVVVVERTQSQSSGLGLF